MEFFGIGLPELLLILVLTLIVVGPQRLPEMAAQIGRFVRDFRRYTSELSRDISDALQDIEREYTEVKEEWKEVGEAVRREGEAIEAEVSGAASEATAAIREEPGAAAPQPASVASLIFTQQLLRWLTDPAKDEVENLEIIFTEPLEYWGTYFRVSLLAGVAPALPVIAYYVELPPALKSLLSFSGDVARPFIRVGSYINFVTRLMLVTGLVFEMPLLVMGLAKLGVVNSRRLWGWWRYALILAFVVAAIVTPSIDPITQSLVAGPIIVLYFVGIFLARLVEARPVLPRQCMRRREKGDK